MGEQGRSPELRHLSIIQVVQEPQAVGSCDVILAGLGALMIDHRGKDPAMGSVLSACTLLKVMISNLSQVRKNISVTNDIVVKCAPWGS